jgi:hypothetical protein
VRVTIATNSWLKRDNDSTVYFPTSETFYSNLVTVYNTEPTVSYRSNQLGINYKLEKDDEDFVDAILVVGEHSGKTKIIFEGISRKVIDIVTGEMDGFVIDGGTW